MKVCGILTFKSALKSPNFRGFGPSNPLKAIGLKVCCHALSRFVSAGAAAAVFSSPFSAVFR